jgi:hypothetical protein
MKEITITIKAKFASPEQEDDGMHNLNVILSAFQQHYGVRHPNNRIKIMRDYGEQENQEPEA